MEMIQLKEAENGEIEIPDKDHTILDSSRKEFLDMIQRENLIYLNAHYDNSRFLT